ncbi:hypothetical protein [Streptomyces sp. SM12]|uniref:hypothetical protein n=1 Tax=Streptomyces sp. SM12 TaxID=1071602 RepID=UPI0011B0CF47|nr:hypothetical protein [Streptomyces sp. SM12]
MRTITGDLADGRRRIIRHHIGETRHASGRTEWITSTLEGRDGEVIDYRGKQFSGRNIVKGRVLLIQILASLTQCAQHTEESDAARAEDVARLLTSKGVEPARVGARLATVDHTPTSDGYVLTQGADYSAALVLHVTGHGPFSELAAVVGVLRGAGYAPGPAGEDFAVTVRGATPQELIDRDRDAALRVGPLVAAVFPG